MRAVFGDPANLIEREDEPEDGLELGPDETSLDFLRKVYRDPRQPMPRRMAAAKEAAPYEHPKLAVTAINNMSGEDFARLLDRAIARSQAPPKAIEHRPDETAPSIRWSGPIGGNNNE